MALINRVLGPVAKQLFARAALSDEVHDALRSFAERCVVARPPELRELKNERNPYLSLEPEVSRPAGDNVVFISSRFRSGSTALWNAFRQLSHVTAYYEPFNERRFFDSVARGTQVDVTHLGVDDYWAEYNGSSGLGELYDEQWIRHALFMGEDAWNPRMKSYIDLLIKQATGRPVLQFNRVDFRLPWLKKHYPNAKFIHLYRNPREQWCSFLVNVDQFPADANPDEFTDHFYLARWARDLQHAMPLLRREQIDHPYQTFYLIWKLSYLFGRSHANHSLSFEELTADPKTSLCELVDALGMERADAKKMESAIKPARPARWGEYADSVWFESHERHCEALLDDFLGVAADSASAANPPKQSRPVS